MEYDDTVCNNIGKHAQVLDTRFGSDLLADSEIFRLYVVLHSRSQQLCEDNVVSTPHFDPKNASGSNFMENFNSVPLQGVVDSKYSFLYHSTFFPGSTHAAKTFGMSNLFSFLRSNLLTLLFYLIGDEAYPLLEYIIKAFTDNFHDLFKSEVNYFLS